MLILVSWDISCEISLRWISLDLTDEKSALVQVMAWSHQATIHCLSSCWPRSVSPYLVTWPQWVHPCNPPQKYRNIKNIFAFSIISQHIWCRLPLLVEAKDLFILHNAMATDDLVRQGSRAPAAMGRRKCIFRRGQNIKILKQKQFSSNRFSSE